MRDVFEERYYDDLAGGILEAFGRLFKNDLKLLTYPYRDRETHDLVTADSLRVENGLEKLREFLIGRESIISLEGYDEKCLKTYSRDVLKKIAADDDAWESMVPDKVVEVIKTRKYFGFGG